MFILHQQNSGNYLSFSSENTSQKMFIGNDTISETANDSDSDGGNFSELSIVSINVVILTSKFPTVVSRSKYT